MSAQLKAGRIRATAGFIGAAVASGLLVAIASLVTSTAAQADTAPAPATGFPATVSSDALPTMQVNGVVSAQVTVGNTVYATGAFSYARPAGQAGSATHVGETAVGNIVAYDITTGKMVTSFIHNMNGHGRSIAASPDGKRIYVGGEFTQVDGLAHNHLVAFSTATGAIDSTFPVKVGSTVTSIAASSTTVYVGGSFLSAGTNGQTSQNETNLAAFDTLGNVSKTWLPTADGIVESMVLAPDKSRVIVGGTFDNLNGTLARGTGALASTSGATLPWALNSTIFSYGANGYIDGLKTDGTLIYGAGVAATIDPNNFEGRFAADPDTGKIVWADDCYGDSYDTQPVGKVLYSVSHDHDCSEIGAFPSSFPANAIYHRTLAETTFPNGGVDVSGGRPNQWTLPVGQPTAQMLDWYPTLSPAPTTAGADLPGTIAVSGTQQAGLSLTANAAGTYLAVGGEFPLANGVAQQGLVRFAAHSIAPDKQGPIYQVGYATPVAAAGTTAGTVNLSWNATWDTDNELLTYQLYRDSGATPIYTTSVPSTFWQTPGFNFIDTKLAAGVHTYTLRVVDPDGNAITQSTSVTVTTGAPAVAPVVPADLALGKATTESSLLNSYQPGGAVDGDTTEASTPAVTNSTQYSWWQVDLGASTPVSTINIFGHTTCCTDQSGDYEVFASNTPFDPRLTPAEQAARSGVVSYAVVGYPGGEKSITLPAGTTARYVLVQHTTTDNLTLYEVQAFAAAPAPAPPVPPVPPVAPAPVTPHFVAAPAPTAFAALPIGVLVQLRASACASSGITCAGMQTATSATCTYPAYTASMTGVKSVGYAMWETASGSCKYAMGTSTLIV